LLAVARDQLKPYAVEICEGTVMSIAPEGRTFTVTLLKGQTFCCRKVLLCTGVVDRIPRLENIEQFYGTSIHHCPYCDGWEHRGGRLAVYGRGRSGTAVALAMKSWSPDIALCTNGPSRLNALDREKLARFDVRVHEQKIARLEGDNGRLSRIAFQDGTFIERTGMFLSTGNLQRSKLPEEMGCALSHKGAVKISRSQRTTVAGVFVAGDAAEDAQFVIVAAAHGARAAMAIDKELQAEDQGE
jgi:thioredoxin reductase